MAQLTPTGVFFCAFCLITQKHDPLESFPRVRTETPSATDRTESERPAQPSAMVLSQSTISPINSTALTGNQTLDANYTMATNAYGVPVNATTAPAGTGVMTQASVLNVLVPVTIASLRRWC